MSEVGGGEERKVGDGFVGAFLFNQANCVFFGILRNILH